jgi:hypothetical protein
MNEFQLFLYLSKSSCKECSGIVCKECINKVIRGLSLEAQER